MVRCFESTADAAPCLLHLDVHRIQFDKDRVAIQFLRNLAHGATARERVENGLAFGAAGQDAGPDEVLRKDRVMWLTT